MRNICSKNTEKPKMIKNGYEPLDACYECRPIYSEIKKVNLKLLQSSFHNALNLTVFYNIKRHRPNTISI